VSDFGGASCIYVESDNYDFYYSQFTSQEDGSCVQGYSPQVTINNIPYNNLLKEGCDEFSCSEIDPVFTIYIYISLFIFFFKKKN
jgi:hypothetical protein